MNTKRILILGVFISSIFLGLGSSEALDITTIVGGQLISINQNDISIIKDNDNKLAQVAINPNTIFQNVQSWKEFKPGDKVQIDYTVNNPTKTAVTITKIEEETVQ